MKERQRPQQSEDPVAATPKRASPTSRLHPDIAITLEVLVDARRERLSAEAKRRAEQPSRTHIQKAQDGVDVTTTKPSRS